MLHQDAVLEDRDLGAIAEFTYRHRAIDGLAPGQEFGLGEDRSAAAPGVPALPATLALGLQAGRSPDAAHPVAVVRPRLPASGLSRTWTTVSAGSSSDRLAPRQRSRPSRRRRRRRRRDAGGSSPASAYLGVRRPLGLPRSPAGVSPPVCYPALHGTSVISSASRRPRPRRPRRRRRRAPVASSAAISRTSSGSSITASAASRRPPPLPERRRRVASPGEAAAPSTASVGGFGRSPPAPGGASGAFAGATNSTLGATIVGGMASTTALATSAVGAGGAVGGGSGVAASAAAFFAERRRVGRGGAGSPLTLASVPAAATWVSAAVAASTDLRAVRRRGDRAGASLPTVDSGASAAIEATTRSGLSQRTWRWGRIGAPRRCRPFSWPGCVCGGPSPGVRQCGRRRRVLFRVVRFEHWLGSLRSASGRATHERHCGRTEAG